MSAYDDGAGFFGRLYDPLMELPENLGLGRLRAQTLRGMRERVLELGIGTGRNIPLYPPSVERLHEIDPDEAMLSRARRTEEAAFPVELVAGSAEELPFDDQGFDAVSATLAFCTIPHPAEALLEARRVLKGGGELRPPRAREYGAQANRVAPGEGDAPVEARRRRLPLGPRHAGPCPRGGLRGGARGAPSRRSGARRLRSEFPRRNDGDPANGE